MTAPTPPPRDGRLFPHEVPGLVSPITFRRFMNTFLVTVHEPITDALTSRRDYGAVQDAVKEQADQQLDLVIPHRIRI